MAVVDGKMAGDGGENDEEARPRPNLPSTAAVATAAGRSCKKVQGARTSCPLTNTNIHLANIKHYLRLDKLLKTPWTENRAHTLLRVIYGASTLARAKR